MLPKGKEFEYMWMYVQERKEKNNLERFTIELIEMNGHKGFFQ